MSNEKIIQMWGFIKMQSLSRNWLNPYCFVPLFCICPPQCKPHQMDFVSGQYRMSLLLYCCLGVFLWPDYFLNTNGTTRNGSWFDMAELCFINKNLLSKYILKKLLQVNAIIYPWKILSCLEGQVLCHTSSQSLLPCPESECGREE